ncbi:MAG: hypothetical protein R3290_00135 [Acidimicrobiia bacterium]|nr:hypothetical protein [Acidimicrobiia bacterium]
MDVAAPFFLAAVIVGIVIWAFARLARRATDRANDAWEEAADRLGLRAVPAGLASFHEMTGDIAGLAIDVHQERHDDTTVTVFTASFGEAGLPFRLRAESGWTRLASWFGVRDVAVGDAVFDEMVRVKADDPDHLAVHLDADRRAAAVAFLGAWDAATIRDGVVEVRRGVTVDDADEIVAIVEDLVAVGRVFDPGRSRHVVSSGAGEGDADIVASPMAAVLGRLDRPALPPPPGHAVAADDLLASVFEHDGGVLGALEVFADRFAGGRLTFRGQVLRSERPGSSRSGTVVVRFAILRDGRYGGRAVEAHLSVGHADRPPSGVEVEASGVLHQVDPVLRRVYLAEGTVTP